MVLILFVLGAILTYMGWWLLCVTRGMRKFENRYCAYDRRKMRLSLEHFYSWGNPFDEYDGPGNW